MLTETQLSVYGSGTTAYFIMKHYVAPHTLLRKKLYIPTDPICDQRTGTRYVKLRTLHLVVPNPAFTFR